MRVRNAVFPVGGLGTRFLPATKALPKEMLPIVDKPLIQYAVEEAAAAGIEEFIFVTGRWKTAIEDHFDHSYELEDLLSSRGNSDELAAIRSAIRTLDRWPIPGNKNPWDWATPSGVRGTWWGTNRSRCCWPTT